MQRKERHAIFLLFLSVTSYLLGVATAISDSDIPFRNLESVTYKNKRVFSSGKEAVYESDPFCYDPDCGMNVTQLITSKGYPCEDHYTLTSDGYWLSIQRIPYGVSGNKTIGGKPVVFLQHGLLDASHTWVINEAYESLGFILADAGYDVWMGNNRGNTYSMSNIYYTPNDNEFWEFSWDEMAKIDLPSMIDYVLNQTGQSQLFYVGHSEGTIQAFAGFENTTLASKIKLFIALAPIAYVGHISSLLIQTMAGLHVDTILEVLGFNHFLIHSVVLETLIDATCDVDKSICNDAMCAVMGCDPGNWNQSRWDVYGYLDPAGTSVQNMNHWGQGVRKDNFCMYNYLTDHENKQHYGSRNPPCYNLANFAAPVALFSGGNDDLADPTDVQRLISELNPSLIKYQTEISYYEHMDFVWGMDAHTVLYPQIISLFEEFA